MVGELLHITFIFFLILDPLGNVPIFVGILRPFPPEKQKQIIIRELLISLAVMIIFLFFGSGFFTILGISEFALQMAGGIILFLIAVRMIFAQPKHGPVTKIPKEPFIVPLAVPAVAGPAILATITLYGGSGTSKLLILGAILLSWLFLLPFLLFSPLLKRWLGENGLVASERLFGFIVVLLATQMAITGLRAALG